MKHRRIWLTALVMGTAVVLGGCGPSSSGKTSSSHAASGEKKQSLLVWEDKDKGKGIKDAVAAFEKKHNVKIKVVEKTYTDQIKDLSLDGPAGTGPDVLTIPSDQVGSAVTQGLLQPLTVSKKIQNSYTKVAMDSQIVEGKVYGLPKAVESIVLFYNKKMISTDKLPKTLDQWYTFSKQERAKGKYGLLALWDQIYYAQGVFQGYGGYIFGKNAKGSYNAKNIGLNNTGSVKAATYISKFYKEGLFPKGILGDQGINALDSLFTNGKAAAVISGPWNFEPYKKAGIDYGVVELPLLANGKHMGSFIGVKSYNVSSYSKNTKLAEQFVKFLTNEKNSEKRYQITQEVPALKSLVDSKLVKDNVNANAVAQQSRHATMLPTITAMNQVWDPANAALEVIATGKSQPKAALDNAVKTIKNAIAANKK